MKIQLIALDLDGTLLLPDKTLSSENHRVLERAAQEGVNIVISTGRNRSGVLRLLEWAPFIRYAVLCNGAIVLDTHTGKAIAEHMIKREDALAYYDFARAHNIMVDCFDRGQRISFPEWRHFVKYEMDASEGDKQLFLNNCTIVEDMRSFLESREEIEKISMRFRNGQEKDRVFQQVVDLFPNLESCSSMPVNIETTCKNVTKAAGLRELASYLGIPMEEVMAFGDSGNDVEMIRAAGIGVAMGNAEEQIKKDADRVTKSNTEDGVAYMIREVFGWQQEL